MHLSMEPLNYQIRLFTKEDVVDEVNDLNIFTYAPINESLPDGRQVGGIFYYKIF